MLGIPEHIEAAVLSAAHILTATAVTVHVLLHRRDVGSSVGWIGLAWLSPVVGSLLYVLLGINRVRRRARSLSVPAADEPPRRAATARLRTSRGPRTAARRISRRTFSLAMRWRCWPTATPRTRR